MINSFMIGIFFSRNRLLTSGHELRIYLIKLLVLLVMYKEHQDVLFILTFHKIEYFLLSFIKAYCQSFMLLQRSWHGN